MKYLLILLLSIAAPLCAQDATIIPSDKLVSDAAFTKIIFNDLNFLVLGETTPSQGFSSELTKDKSELSVKGLLAINKHVLWTADANFIVNDGVYFFDEDGGSKTSKLQANLFVPVGAGWGFKPATVNNDTRRVMLHNSVLKKINITEEYIKFYKLYKLCERVGIPIENTFDSIPVIKKNAQNESLKDFIPERNDLGIVNNISKATIIKHQNDATYIKWLKELKIPLEKESSESSFSMIQREYEISINDTSSLEIILNPAFTEITKTKTLDVVENTNPQQFESKTSIDTIIKIVNINKLMDAYEASLKDLKNLDDVVTKKEIENADKHWQSKLLPYLGFSAYYQRESINLFTPVPNASFNNLFDITLGDLYGVSASGNIFFQKGKKYVYGRVKASYGRGSNIDSFKKNTFVLNTAVDDSIPGVTTSKQEVGYTSAENKGYQYGATSTETLELYGSLGTVGAFFIIGHSGTYFDFENTGLNDTNKYPARLGLLFNLKHKKDAKNAITLQAFVDRSDISIDPTGTIAKPIDDWRFGFQIGLPIYLKAKKEN